MVEYCCNIDNIMMGSNFQGMQNNISCQQQRVPLGVCAGVTPIYFSAMIPLSMFSVAIATGNTFILKPSEKIAGVSAIFSRICKEINLPKGVFNIVQGGKVTVRHLLNDKRLKAISFVGASDTGQKIRKKAAQLGLKHSVLMQTKSHAVIMPDAIKKNTIKEIFVSGFEETGQKFMD